MTIVLLRAWRAMALALVLVASPAAFAGPIGTQGLADMGAPSTNTGDINTATTFTIGDLVSTASQSGIFVGMPTQDFGSVGPFAITNGPTATLTFGDAVFGTFTSSSEIIATDTGGLLSLYFDGLWTPGTYGGVAGGPFAASVTFSATQTPAHTGAISDSATFAVPPAGFVPEPSAIMLLTVGGTGLFGFRLMRRKRA